MKFKLPQWVIGVFPNTAAFNKGFEDFNDPTTFNKFHIDSDEYREYERGSWAAYFKQLKTTKNIERSKAKKNV